MSEKDYYNAMYYYQTALEFDSSDLQLRYYYGEAATKLRAFVLAEECFQYIVDEDDEQSYPLAPYKLARAQHFLGKYDDAERNYQLYLSENSGEDAYYTARSEKEIEALDWAREKAENPREGVTVNRLDNNINSPYSEFAAIKSDGDIYFSSMRFEKPEKKRRIKRLFSKVMKSESDGLTEALDDSFHEGGQHFANLAFNFDASQVYYTICNYEENNQLRCDLYRRIVDDDGQWGEAIKLPNTVNDSLSTNTQPAIAYDINIDKEILYFVSDREGGKGKLDIWYSVIQGEDFLPAQNLAELNTNEDDLSPFFHAPTSTLYFSTNGRLGMGGYDIFSSKKTDEGYTLPENLEAPINTSFDDVYYRLNAEGTEAYFSSNRIGSLYLDTSFEACCYDIYQAILEKILVDLNIISFNGLTKEPLDGTRVVVIDPLTDEVLYENINPFGNEHNFKLQYGREYTIITEKEGFLPNETSIKINQFEPINKQIYLTPKSVRLEVLTYDADTEEELPGVNISIINLSDADSSPQMKLNEDSNTFDFDINAGYDYQIVAEKDGYETVIRKVNKDLLIDDVIRELIYMRNIDLNEYLPVHVYFDNDRPNPRSYSLYTELNYSETYSDYVNKKQEFKEQFVLDLNDNLKIEAEAKQEQFFEKDVKGGYRKLQLFIDKLKQRLESGDQIELSFKGYASPRAQNKYNLAIGQRRIWTLKNELKDYEKGILREYIESGMLKVVEVSFGEEAAPSDVSDSYEDKRQSIYSVQASRQRKAEIVRVRVIN